MVVIDDVVPDIVVFNLLPDDDKGDVFDVVFSGTTAFAEQKYLIFYLYGIFFFIFL